MICFKGSSFYNIFFLGFRYKVSSTIPREFMDELLLAFLLKEQRGTLQLRHQKRLKQKRRINTSLETPVTSIYIFKSTEKKVTDLLKTCQMAFNHGAAGHPASREQRCKISSGAISLESLWSSALLELNLLCHRVRIHGEGQISIFFFHR